MDYQVNYSDNFRDVNPTAINFIKKYKMLNFEILSSYTSLIEDPLKFGDNLEIFSVVIDKSIRLFTFRTIPFNILISHSEDDKAVKNLVEYIWENRIKFPGIYGPLNVIRNFRNEWHKLSGENFQTKDEMWLYFLEKLKVPSKNIGHVIRANENHLTRVNKWSNKAVKELMPEAPESFLESCRQNLSYRIKEQKIFLLNYNDEFVSMATISRETEKLQIINNVFTPPKYRGRGYATEICSLIANRIRKKGNYPILTVNTENKPAINIYEKIGFQKKGKVGLFLH